MRDMDRAKAILDALFEEALQAALDKAHKPHWVGIGLRVGTQSIKEESAELCQALSEAEPTNREDVLHARQEAGQLVWSIAMTLDDSGMLLPLEEEAS